MLIVADRAIYTDDLALDTKNLNCGRDVGDINISLLLHADRIVHLAPTEQHVHQILDKMHGWCAKKTCDDIYSHGLSRQVR